MLTKTIIFMLAFLLFFHGGKTSQLQLQVLGFQEWEQPSPQEIKAQFDHLTEEYNKNANKDAQATEKYEKIKKAYQQVSKTNFRSGQQQGSRRRDNFGRRSRPRRERSGFYDNYDSYEAHNSQFSSFHTFNVDQILNNFNYDFASQGQPKHQNNFNFLKFLIKNPVVPVAAFLISLGLIHLCSCCCCCCCCRCCRRSHEEELGSGQGNQKRGREKNRDSRENLSNLDRKWLQKIKQKNG